jgi:hypothetical protein
MMLTSADLAVLDVFRNYLVAPGEMLCFHGKWLDDHGESLQQLTALRLITKEHFKGGYSLTQAGFDQIQNGDATAKTQRQQSSRAE